MGVGDRAEAGVAQGSPDAESSATSGRRDPLLGTVINGKFRIISAIARGGMGRIYYATQQPLDRPVALKVVQGDGANEHESQFLKRFLQEASILAKLQHPNVVTLYDYGRIEGSPIEQYFIAMEYLAGETLTARLQARRMLDIRETLILGRQIARGLREAHARGIVHRDLKPSNVLLVPESDGGEIVKIVDFGIGKVIERTGDTQDLTQDGFLVGTPRFMAPEQFEGTASPASDLYALGTILYLCVTGRLPYGGANMAELMVAKMAQPVPPMHEVNPEILVPQSFEALCRQLLARRPEERPTDEQLFAQLGMIEDEVFGSSQSLRRPFVASPAGGVPYGSSPPSRSNSVPVLTGVGGVSANPADRLSTGDRLKVPHTIVAPVGSLTPRPMEAPAMPAPPARSRAPLVVAILGPLLIAAGAVVWLFALRPRASTTVPPVAATSAPSGSAASPPNEAPAAFTLSIDSSPAGATVYENDQALGPTPFQMNVTNESVTAHPRTFIVKKEGYADFSVVQGPSRDAVKSMVTLAPEPHDPVKSRPKPAGVPPTAKPAATPAPTGLDIRIKR
jgi:serine/threonine-protein kinase